MRLTTLIVVVTLLVGGVTTAQAKSRRDECRYAGANGRRGLQRPEVKATIRCVARHFNVSTSQALYIADRESDFRPKARNSSSGACGIYQAIPRYWPLRIAVVPDRYRRWSRSCFNGRSNILAHLNMARKFGWGAWS